VYYNWGAGVLKPHTYVLALPAVQYPYPEGEDASYRSARALAYGIEGEEEEEEEEEEESEDQQIRWFSRGMGGVH